MAKNRMKINAAVQERLGEVAAELWQVIYGEQRVPEWGRISHRVRKPPAEPVTTTVTVMSSSRITATDRENTFIVL